MNGKQHKSIMEAFQYIGYMIACTVFAMTSFAFGLLNIVTHNLVGATPCFLAGGVGSSLVAICLMKLTANYFKTAREPAEP